MSDASPHKNNAADIRRYHAGEMTPQERHALEKAALDDPFLADALEGYVHSKTPDEDLAFIRQKLFAEKQDESKVVPLRFSMVRWMSVAALLVVLAGGGWLVYTSLYQPKTGDMARQQPKPEIQGSSPAATTLDAAATENKIPLVDSLHTATTNPIPPGDTAVPVLNADLTLQRNTVRKASVKPPIETEQMDSTVQTLTAVAAAGDANSFLNEVVVARPDSAAAADVAIIRQTNDSLQVNITMKPAADANKNLEVVGLNTNDTKRKAMPRMQTFTQELEPNQAWNSFQDYVSQNLKEPERYRAKESGANEVVLSFDVNEKGEPINISVVRSSCATCNREAIRLLKAGPKWKRNDQNKGLVTIKF